MRLGSGSFVQPNALRSFLPHWDIRHRTLCCPPGNDFVFLCTIFLFFFWCLSVVPAVDFTRSRGSSVSTVTWLWVARRRDSGSIPGRGQALCFSPNRPDLLLDPSSPPPLFNRHRSDCPLVKKLPTSSYCWSQEWMDVYRHAPCKPLWLSNGFRLLLLCCTAGVRTGHLLTTSS